MSSEKPEIVDKLYEKHHEHIRQHVIFCGYINEKIVNSHKIVERDPKWTKMVQFRAVVKNGLIFHKVREIMKSYPRKVRFLPLQYYEKNDGSEVQIRPPPKESSKDYKINTLHLQVSRVEHFVNGQDNDPVNFLVFFGTTNPVEVFDHTVPLEEKKLFEFVHNFSEEMMEVVEDEGGFLPISLTLEIINSYWEKFLTKKDLNPPTASEDEGEEEDEELEEEPIEEEEEEKAGGGIVGFFSSFAGFVIRQIKKHLYKSFILFFIALFVYIGIKKSRGK